MKNRFYFTVILLFSINTIQAQRNAAMNSQFHPTNSNITFDLQDYKKQSQLKGDTIWLPCKQETYLWNGEELEKEAMFVYLAYNNPDELSEEIIMDSNTNDTLYRFSYDFDDLSRKTKELYEIYITEDHSWKIDSRSLITYNQFDCIDTNLRQVWEANNGVWRDSIAEVLEWADTNQILMYMIKKIENGEWYGTHGTRNRFVYNNDNYIYQDYEDIFNVQNQEWENHYHATYELNDNGSWSECTIYLWNNSENIWDNHSKITVTDWFTYGSYPLNEDNWPTERMTYWWVGNEYMAYLHQIWTMINLNKSDYDHVGYSRFSNESNWFLSDSIKIRHYDDGRKRRYTYYKRREEQAPLEVFYDDSCRWYFYKGALKEMYRVCIDTTTNQWRPAARLVYSDFVPFVDISNVEEHQIQTETLQLIPNPADDSFTIENIHEITEILIFNINGKLIRREDGLLDNPAIRIDVTGFSPGTYIVKARKRENRWLNSKVVIK